MGMEQELSDRAAQEWSLEGAPTKVLVVTGMYPSQEHPAFGTFVKRQIDSLSIAGCPHEVLLIDGRRSRWNYLKAIWRVNRALRAGQFGMVHAYYGLCGFVASWQFRVPLMVSYCGSDLNPGFAGRERAPLRSLLIFILGQVASWRAAACVVRSQEMLSRLLLPSVRKRAHIVTSGVDLELFRPSDRSAARARLAWEPDHPVVLFVCADPELPAVKQPQLARAAVESAKQAIPNVELRIVAGKPQAELPDYYNASDLLLLTSANEGSPNVVKEAMACDLPVISTPVGDVPGLLAGAQNCHVCSPDPDELGASIVRVLRSGERGDSRERMQKYSLDNTAATLLEIYREVFSSDRTVAELAAQAERPGP
jgi:glycosyltransferase involved in cell wall biosynthesis